MKLIYSHPNVMIVGSMASALSEIGIDTEIRNDILGGATGEIAPGETWVELWIVDDSKAEDAKNRIQEITEQPESDDWICNHCMEANPATFELCWQCNKPTEATA